VRQQLVQGLDDRGGFVHRLRAVMRKHSILGRQYPGRSERLDGFADHPQRRRPTLSGLLARLGKLGR
jgi:hypothetical protein